ncbi:hypothetical protein PIB30_108859, partial [Stylosanthes scabra]|nr:hypothetical protein [Stylosanthes scabra]
TFSSTIPSWLRKTKIVKMLSKAWVNHLGLTLTKEDLQSVVDLMEPYGQISNGIELLSPPLDVRNNDLSVILVALNTTLLMHNHCVLSFLKFALTRGQRTSYILHSFLLL